MDKKPCCNFNTYHVSIIIKQSSLLALKSKNVPMYIIKFGIKYFCIFFASQDVIPILSYFHMLCVQILCQKRFRMWMKCDSLIILSHFMMPCKAKRARNFVSKTFKEDSRNAKLQES